MTNANKLSIFACDNGDAILLEADGKTVMTDINYRDTAADPDDDDCPDFGAEIRSACANHHLSVFVLTHPDVDHCRGFGDIFHVGDPANHDSDPAEGHVKIVVDEIWCSPYAADPNYVTDDAKPLVDEIKRRHKLKGTAKGQQAGNKLFVRSLADVVDGSLSPNVSWRLLAPTASEATIPKRKATETCDPSSNSSSLVVQWTVKVNGKDNLLLLGGDSTVEIWERIHKDNEKTLVRLRWHVLVAPHHCSRRSLGKRNASNEFEYSKHALDALGHMQGSGRVVVSSKEIKKNDDDPPSWSAKQQYLKSLAPSGQQDAESRFHCTGTHDEGKPGHVLFDLTAGGPTLKVGSPRSYSSGNRVGGGGGYG